MKRSKLNALVDIFIFIPLLISAFSGIVLWQVLPEGTGFQGGREVLDHQFFLGMPRHSWREVHHFSGLAFIILAIVHLILHWSFIKRIPKIFKS